MGAISFIENMDESSLSITKEEFDKYEYSLFDRQIV